MKNDMTRAGFDAGEMPGAFGSRAFGPGALGNLWQMLGTKLRTLQLRFGAVSRAHDRRRAYEAFGPDAMADIGFTPETATGIPNWQADLPFFMQSGFGRR